MRKILGVILSLSLLSGILVLCLVGLNGRSQNAAVRTLPIGRLYEFYTIPILPQHVTVLSPPISTTVVPHHITQPKLHNSVPIPTGTKVQRVSSTVIPSKTPITTPVVASGGTTNHPVPIKTDKAPQPISSPVPLPTQPVKVNNPLKVVPVLKLSFSTRGNSGNLLSLNGLGNKVMKQTTRKVINTNSKGSQNMPYTRWSNRKNPSNHK